jgi:hypothetical protein
LHARREHEKALLEEKHMSSKRRLGAVSKNSIYVVTAPSIGIVALSRDIDGAFESLAESGLVGIVTRYEVPKIGPVSEGVWVGERR